MNGWTYQSYYNILLGGSSRPIRDVPFPSLRKLKCRNPQNRVLNVGWERIAETDKSGRGAADFDTKLSTIGKP